MAAIALATTEDSGTGGSYRANWEHGIAMATMALEARAVNYTKPELVLLPEAFATGYPPCCDLAPHAENRSSSPVRARPGRLSAL